MAERLKARDILSSGGADDETPAAPAKTGLFRYWSSNRTPDGAKTPTVARIRATAAGAALVLLAGGAWWGQRAPEPTAATPQPATRVPAASELPPNLTIIRVQFADASHAYALIGRCAGAAKCWYELRASTDGGRTWRGRHVPLKPVAPPDGYSGELAVLGASSVLVTDRGQRLFSADTGRTWRDTPLDTGRTVPAAAPGALLVGACPYGYVSTNGCAKPLAALDARTGQQSALANQPPFRAALGADRAVAGSDGSLWIAGTTGNKLLVSVTRDRGRTWRTAPLAMPTTPLLGVSIVTHDGRTAYAFVRAQAPPDVQVKNGLASIWRTTDGGANWYRVPSRQPESVLGVALLPDGRLLVTTEMQDSQYSTDGGRTFQRGTATDLGWIEEVDGRYVAGGLFGGYLISRDGVSWTPLNP